ncbi:hypothetical protein ACH36K_01450 [Clostridium sp. MB05]|uniref:hypothetical protein n=1 Tax=Clostridium sp. MB05 TaxID=3376682 RepID=UPI0039825A48
MAVVRRGPVPSTKDNKEAKTKPKEIERKLRKTAMQVMKEAREKMEQERLEKEKYNQEVEEELMEETEEEKCEPVAQEVEMVEVGERFSEINMEDFKASESVVINKKITGKGCLTVINSTCGRRVVIAKDVMNKLKHPTQIAMSFSNDSIAIGEKLPNNNNLLTVKDYRGKTIIYSASLVNEITNNYNLDFSDKTSITFSEVKYIEKNGYPIALIRVA